MKRVTLGDRLSRSSDRSTHATYSTRCNIYLLGRRGFILQSLAAAVVAEIYCLRVVAVESSQSIRHVVLIFSIFLPAARVTLSAGDDGEFE